MRLLAPLLVLLALLSGLVPPCADDACAEFASAHQESEQGEREDRCGDACLRCCARFISAPDSFVPAAPPPPAAYAAAEHPPRFEGPPVSVWHPPRS